MAVPPGMCPTLSETPKAGFSHDEAPGADPGFLERGFKFTKGGTFCKFYPTFQINPHPGSGSTTGLIYIHGIK